MLGSIKYNLTHLLDFHGRDARQTFWFYVLFLVILNFALGMVIMIPVMGNMMTAVAAAARTGASEQEIQQQIAGRVGGLAGNMVWVSTATHLITIALLAAAFVRRLHDSDKTGWWAWLAIGVQVLAIVVSIRMVGIMQGVMAHGFGPASLSAISDRQAELGWYPLAGWIGPLTIIVFGVMQSTEGPNRFGEEPIRF